MAAQHGLGVLAGALADEHCRAQPVVQRDQASRFHGRVAISRQLAIGLGLAQRIGELFFEMVQSRDEGLVGEFRIGHRQHRVGGADEVEGPAHLVGR